MATKGDIPESVPETRREECVVDQGTPVLPNELSTEEKTQVDQPHKVPETLESQFNVKNEEQSKEGSEVTIEGEMFFRSPSIPEASSDIFKHTEAPSDQKIAATETSKLAQEKAGNFFESEPAEKTILEEIGSDEADPDTTPSCKSIPEDIANNKVPYDGNKIIETPILSEPPNEKNEDMKPELEASSLQQKEETPFQKDVKQAVTPEESELASESAEESQRKTEVHCKELEEIAEAQKNPSVIEETEENSSIQQVEGTKRKHDEKPAMANDGLPLKEASGEIANEDTSLVRYEVKDEDDKLSTATQISFLQEESQNEKPVELQHLVGENIEASALGKEMETSFFKDRSLNANQHTNIGDQSEEKTVGAVDKTEENPTKVLTVPIEEDRILHANQQEIIGDQSEEKTVDAVDMTEETLENALTVPNEAAEDLKMELEGSEIKREELHQKECSKPSHREASTSDSRDTESAAALENEGLRIRELSATAENASLQIAPLDMKTTACSLEIEKTSSVEDHISTPKPQVLVDDNKKEKIADAIEMKEKTLESQNESSIVSNVEIEGQQQVEGPLMKLEEHHEKVSHKPSWIEFSTSNSSDNESTTMQKINDENEDLKQTVEFLEEVENTECLVPKAEEVEDHTAETLPPAGEDIKQFKTYKDAETTNAPEERSLTINAREVQCDNTDERTIDFANEKDKVLDVQDVTAIISTAVAEEDSLIQVDGSELEHLKKESGKSSEVSPLYNKADESSGTHEVKFEYDAQGKAEMYNTARNNELIELKKEAETEISNDYSPAPVDIEESASEDTAITVSVKEQTVLSNAQGTVGEKTESETKDSTDTKKDNIEALNVETSIANESIKEKSAIHEGIELSKFSQATDTRSSDEDHSLPLHSQGNLSDQTESSKTGLTDMKDNTPDSQHFSTSVSNDTEENPLIQADDSEMKQEEHLEKQIEQPACAEALTEVTHDDGSTVDQETNIEIEKHKSTDLIEKYDKEIILQNPEAEVEKPIENSEATTKDTKALVPDLDPKSTSSLEEQSHTICSKADNERDDAVDEHNQSPEVQKTEIFPDHIDKAVTEHGIVNLDSTQLVLKDVNYIPDVNQPGRPHESTHTQGSSSTDDKSNVHVPIPGEEDIDKPAADCMAESKKMIQDTDAMHEDNNLSDKASVKDIQRSAIKSDENEVTAADEVLPVKDIETCIVTENQSNNVENRDLKINAASNEPTGDDIKEIEDKVKDIIDQESRKQVQKDPELTIPVDDSDLKIKEDQSLIAADSEATVDETKSIVQEKSELEDQNLTEKVEKLHEEGKTTDNYEEEETITAADSEATVDETKNTVQEVQEDPELTIPGDDINFKTKEATSPITADETKNTVQKKSELEDQNPSEGVEKLFVEGQTTDIHEEEKTITTADSEATVAETKNTDQDLPFKKVQEDSELTVIGDDINLKTKADESLTTADSDITIDETKNTDQEEEEPIEMKTELEDQNPIEDVEKLHVEGETADIYEEEKTITTAYSEATVDETKNTAEEKSGLEEPNQTEDVEKLCVEDKTTDNYEDERTITITVSEVTVDENKNTGQEIPEMEDQNLPEDVEKLCVEGQMTDIHEKEKTMSTADSESTVDEMKNTVQDVPLEKVQENSELTVIGDDINLKTKADESLTTADSDITVDETKNTVQEGEEPIEMKSEQEDQSPIEDVEKLHVEGKTADNYEEEKTITTAYSQATVDETKNTVEEKSGQEDPNLTEDVEKLCVEGKTTDNYEDERTITTTVSEVTVDENKNTGQEIPEMEDQNLPEDVEKLCVEGQTTDIHEKEKTMSTADSESTVDEMKNTVQDVPLEKVQENSELTVIGDDINLKTKADESLTTADSDITVDETKNTVQEREEPIEIKSEVEDQNLIEDVEELHVEGETTDIYEEEKTITTADSEATVDETKNTVQELPIKKSELEDQNLTEDVEKLCVEGKTTDNYEEERTITTTVSEVTVETKNTGQEISEMEDQNLPEDVENLCVEGQTTGIHEKEKTMTTADSESTVDETKNTVQDVPFKKVQEDPELTITGDDINLKTTEDKSLITADSNTNNDETKNTVQEEPIEMKSELEDQNLIEDVEKLHVGGETTGMYEEEKTITTVDSEATVDETKNTIQELPIKKSGLEDPNLTEDVEKLCVEGKTTDNYEDERTITTTVSEVTVDENKNTDQEISKMEDQNLTGDIEKLQVELKTTDNYEDKTNTEYPSEKESYQEPSMYIDNSTSFQSDKYIDAAVIVPEASTVNGDCVSVGKAQSFSEKTDAEKVEADPGEQTEDQILYREREVEAQQNPVAVIVHKEPQEKHLLDASHIDSAPGGENTKAGDSDEIKEIQALYGETEEENQQNPDAGSVQMEIGQQQLLNASQKVSAPSGEKSDELHREKSAVDPCGETEEQMKRNLEGGRSHREIGEEKLINASREVSEPNAADSEEANNEEEQLINASEEVPEPNGVIRDGEYPKQNNEPELQSGERERETEHNLKAETEQKEIGEEPAINASPEDSESKGVNEEEADPEQSKDVHGACRETEAERQHNQEAGTDYREISKEHLINAFPGVSGPNGINTEEADPEERKEVQGPQEEIEPATQQCLEAGTRYKETGKEVIIDDYPQDLQQNEVDDGEAHPGKNKEEQLPHGETFAAVQQNLESAIVLKETEEEQLLNASPEVTEPNGGNSQEHDPEESEELHITSKEIETEIQQNLEAGPGQKEIGKEQPINASPDISGPNEVSIEEAETEECVGFEVPHGDVEAETQQNLEEGTSHKVTGDELLANNSLNVSQPIKVDDEEADPEKSKQEHVPHAERQDNSEAAIDLKKTGEEQPLSASLKVSESNDSEEVDREDGKRVQISHGERETNMQHIQEEGINQMEKGKDLVLNALPEVSSTRELNIEEVNPEESKGAKIQEEEREAETGHKLINVPPEVSAPTVADIDEIDPEEHKVAQIPNAEKEAEVYKEIHRENLVNDSMEPSEPKEVDTEEKISADSIQEMTKNSSFILSSEFSSSKSLHGVEVPEPTHTEEAQKQPEDPCIQKLEKDSFMETENDVLLSAATEEDSSITEGMQKLDPTSLLDHDEDRKQNTNIQETEVAENEINKYVEHTEIETTLQDDLKATEKEQDESKWRQESVKVDEKDKSKYTASAEETSDNFQHYFEESSQGRDDPTVERELIIAGDVPCTAKTSGDGNEEVRPEKEGKEEEIDKKGVVDFCSEVLTISKTASEDHDMMVSGGSDEKVSCKVAEENYSGTTKTIDSTVIEQENSLKDILVDDKSIVEFKTESCDEASERAETVSTVIEGQVVEQPRADETACKTKTENLEAATDKGITSVPEEQDLQDLVLPSNKVHHGTSSTIKQVTDEGSTKDDCKPDDTINEEFGAEETLKDVSLNDNASKENLEPEQTMEATESVVRDQIFDSIKSEEAASTRKGTCDAEPRKVVMDKIISEETFEQKTNTAEEEEITKVGTSTEKIKEDEEVTKDLDSWERETVPESSQEDPTMNKVETFQAINNANENEEVPGALDEDQATAGIWEKTAYNVKAVEDSDEQLLGNKSIDKALEEKQEDDNVNEVTTILADKELAPESDSVPLQIQSKESVNKVQVSTVVLQEGENDRTVADKVDSGITTNVGKNTVDAVAGELSGTLDDNIISRSASIKQTQEQVAVDALDGNEGTEKPTMLHQLEGHEIESNFTVLLSSESKEAAKEGKKDETSVFDNIQEYEEAVTTSSLIKEEKTGKAENCSRLTEPDDGSSCIDTENLDLSPESKNISETSPIGGAGDNPKDVESFTLKKELPDNQYPDETTGSQKSSVTEDVEISSEATTVDTEFWKTKAENVLDAAPDATGVAFMKQESTESLLSPLAEDFELKEKGSEGAQLNVGMQDTGFAAEPEVESCKSKQEDKASEDCKQMAEKSTPTESNSISIQETKQKNATGMSQLIGDQDTDDIYSKLHDKPQVSLVNNSDARTASGGGSPDIQSARDLNEDANELSQSSATSNERDPLSPVQHEKKEAKVSSEREETEIIPQGTVSGFLIHEMDHPRPVKASGSVSEHTGGNNMKNASSRSLDEQSSVTTGGESISDILKGATTDASQGAKSEDTQEQDALPILADTKYSYKEMTQIATFCGTNEAEPEEAPNPASDESVLPHADCSTSTYEDSDGSKPVLHPQHGYAPAEAKILNVSPPEEEQPKGAQDKGISDEATIAFTEREKHSLSELLQTPSIKQSLPVADQWTGEKEGTISKEEMLSGKSDETKKDEPKIDEETQCEEEPTESKNEDHSSEALIMVEMEDADVKVAHKKSHNILSGVGSKVKHSISKVKKAITGKSSHPKPPSPKHGDKH